MSIFSTRLRNVRRQRKLSLTQLGEKVGVAKSTIAGYESDYREPPLETVQQMATVLHTSVDYLLGLTDDIEPREQSKNARELLTYENLHWDGIPLEEADLEPIRMLLERVVKERVPSDTKELYGYENS